MPTDPMTLALIQAKADGDEALVAQILALAKDPIQSASVMGLGLDAAMVASDGPGSMRDRQRTWDAKIQSDKKP